MIEGGRQSGDEERLPWLEPYRDAATATPRPRPVAKPRAGVGSRIAMLIAGIAVVGAALGGGYWLGRQEPPPRVTKSVEVTNDPIPAESIAAISDAQSELTETPETVAEPPPAIVDKIAPTKKKPVVARSRPAATSLYERKLAAAARDWPKRPSPGPPGQVIQLGAFSTEARAEAAYDQRSARYPLLATMPRVVVPVVTRPRGDVLYVLRLGTASREQSEIVCRNLKASGDHCLVIG
jgi:hypothetical protein